jgi:hypothetical protein
MILPDDRSHLRSGVRAPGGSSGLRLAGSPPVGLTYKWARHSHPSKPKRWVTARYFGEFNKSRQDRWVFGDRPSGRYLTKFAWTPIVRHRMVQERRRWTIPPWPISGPSGDAAVNPRWPAPSYACCRYRAGAARYVGHCCCTSTANHSIPMHGNSGSRPSATRSANTRSPLKRPVALRTIPPSHALSTPTANVAAPTAPMATQHLCPPASLRGLLEP